MRSLFFLDDGGCHLQDANASPKGAASSVASGPAICETEDITQHNYCRDPGGVMGQAFCYTANGPRIDVCDIEGFVEVRVGETFDDGSSVIKLEEE